MKIKSLEKEISKENIENLKLDELKEIKAIAYKSRENNKENRDYMRDKCSCGWSVCHCATYGCN